MNIEKQPLVSVGIPTYNRPDGLKRTLDCITQQTYQNIEIIVSDNHSIDPKVEKVVREFQKKDTRISYFKQLENKGAVFNFNFLLEQAIGEYFMWAADDDEWEPEFIQICLKEFDQDTNLVVPKMQVLYRDSNRTENILLPNISKQNSKSENVYSFLERLTPSMFYGLYRKASLVSNYEDMNFDFSDCYMTTKILLSGQAKVLNMLKKPLYTAGVNGAEYIVKPANPKKDRTLTYLPYVKKQIRLIISSSISLNSKFKLSHKFLVVILSLFMYHEKKYKDINITNKLRFILIQLLLTFDFRLTWVFRKINLIKENFNKIINSKKIINTSHSQCGEDLIIRFVFNALGISKPSYIDIGAYDAYKFSNTAIFYEQGSRGINIEPNPNLLKSFLKNRNKDINLNFGVAASSGFLDFYIMSALTLSTFSDKELENYVANGYSIEEVIKVPVMTISEIIEKYHHNKFPDFLSLDVEGLDLEILKSIDYRNSSPIVICVETISFSETVNGVKDINIISFSETVNGVKDINIISFLESKGYMVYADTYINTIFVKKSEWVRS